MKSILNIFNLSFLTAILLLATGCSDDNSSALRLNEDTAIKSFALDNYSGVIDPQKETITITLPEDYDMAAMTVTDIQLPGRRRGDPQTGRCAESEHDADCKSIQWQRIPAIRHPNEIR